jgi:hypothetical protein
MDPSQGFNSLIIAVQPFYNNATASASISVQVFTNVALHLNQTAYNRTAPVNVTSTVAGALLQYSVNSGPWQPFVEGESVLQCSGRLQICSLSLVVMVCAKQGSHNETLMAVPGVETEFCVHPSERNRLIIQVFMFYQWGSDPTSGSCDFQSRPCPRCECVVWDVFESAGT